MMTDEATRTFEQTIKEMLKDRFGGELEFGPILVMPKVDHDGERYLHSYIVFDGNQENLDPTWTLSLSNSLWAQAEQLEYPGIPILLFVKRSEWADLERKIVLSEPQL